MFLIFYRMRKVWTKCLCTMFILGMMVHWNATIRLHWVSLHQCSSQFMGRTWTVLHLASIFRNRQKFSHKFLRNLPRKNNVSLQTFSFPILWWSNGCNQCVTEMWTFVQEEIYGYANRMRHPRVYILGCSKPVHMQTVQFIINVCLVHIRLSPNKFYPSHQIWTFLLEVEHRYAGM